MLVYEGNDIRLADLQSAVVQYKRGAADLGLNRGLRLLPLHDEQSCMTAGS